MGTSVCNSLMPKSMSDNLPYSIKTFPSLLKSFLTYRMPILRRRSMECEKCRIIRSIRTLLCCFLLPILKLGFCVWGTDDESELAPLSPKVRNTIFRVAEFFNMSRAGRHTPIATVSRAKEIIGHRWLKIYQRKSSHTAGGRFSSIDSTFDILPDFALLSRYFFIS